MDSLTARIELVKLIKSCDAVRSLINRRRTWAPSEKLKALNDIKQRQEVFRYCHNILEQLDGRDPG